MILLAACSGGERSAPRPRRDGLPPASRPAPPPAETAACLADLQGLGVRFNPLPDRRFAGQCTALGAVQLLDIGLPVTNLGAMTCPVARTFTQWVKNGIQPAAREILGTEIVRLESMGTYSCRTIAGSARLSEHALANAVDIAVFVMADGRRVSVLNGWAGASAEEREFLAVVHRSACRRFRTVLGPDYNAAHRDHLHMDMGRGPFCR
ncbi:extensin family protein [Sphingomonas jejuensis]|uniref:extensin family protein n=1 Tax=Sphingomonas jejuensis TaxID=904715 RepID=UPI001FD7AF54|nr:extensin family protein [Sphingomonas jejuensis]